MKMEFLLVFLPQLVLMQARPRAAACLGNEACKEVFVVNQPSLATVSVSVGEAWMT